MPRNATPFTIYETLVRSYMPRDTSPARVRAAAMHGWRAGIPSVDAAFNARERARCPRAYDAWQRKRIAYARQDRARVLRTWAGNRQPFATLSNPRALRVLTRAHRVLAGLAQSA